MYSRALDTRRGTVTIRPLRSGDTETVQAVFDGLGERSRRLRFGYAKSSLTPQELELLARVDGRRHVLVGYAHRRPVGLARLARLEHADEAEIAYAVVDEWQGLGIGTELAKLLAADAAAIGITRLHATIQAENRASLTVMKRATTVIARRFEAGELHLVGLPAA